MIVTPWWAAVFWSLLEIGHGLAPLSPHPLVARFALSRPMGTRWWNLSAIATKKIEYFHQANGDSMTVFFTYK